MAAARSNPNSGYLYVLNLNAGGTGPYVSVYKPPYNAVTQTILGFKNPTQMALDASGRLWVVDNKGPGYNADVYAISPDFSQKQLTVTDEQAAPTAGGPNGIAIDDQDNVYVACELEGEVDVFRVKNGKPERQRRIGMPGVFEVVVDHGNNPRVFALSNSGLLYADNPPLNPPIPTGWAGTPPSYPQVHPGRSLAIEPLLNGARLWARNAQSMVFLQANRGMDIYGFDGTNAALVKEMNLKAIVYPFAWAFDKYANLFVAAAGWPPAGVCPNSGPASGTLFVFEPGPSAPKTCLHHLASPNAILLRGDTLYIASYGESQVERWAITYGANHTPQFTQGESLSDSVSRPIDLAIAR